MEAYLDNSATTRPCERAVEAASACMREYYHNPSALYKPAMEMEKELLRARRVTADSIGAGEHGVIFTSGGTESNNMAVLGHLLGQRRDGVILCGAAEHPSVKNACAEAAILLSHTVMEIPLERSGGIDLYALEKLLSDRVRLICVMQVCNETGVIMPLDGVIELRNRLAPAAAIHVDGVQGFLRLPMSMREKSIQSYSVSAHKIHGPKGVGALIIRDGHRMRPIMYGGGQQNGMRSGTENTPGIMGMCAAIEDYPDMASSLRRLTSLKSLMLRLIKTPGIALIGGSDGDEGLAPHIISVAFPPVRAETLVHALEAQGVYIGTGSACSSRKAKRSPVLTAMRLDSRTADCAVRISLSVHNTEEEIKYAAQKINECVRTLSLYARR